MFYPFAFLDFLFPPYCFFCGRILVKGEHFLCLHCLDYLDEIEFRYTGQFYLQEYLREKIPIKYATSLFHYRRPSPLQVLIYEFKYRHRIAVGEFFGRLLADHLQSREWIKEIDVIVPIPLHWTRKLYRGYNQSEVLAAELSKRLNVPYDTEIIKRIRRTKAQAKQSKDKRKKNVENAFRVNHPEMITGKHILLVDDVITTGGTIGACLSALSNVEGVQVSACSIATPLNKRWAKYRKKG